MLSTIGGFVLEHWQWLAGGGGVAGAALGALVPGAGPFLLFLRANWTWLVPSAIALAAGLYAGIQRMNYLECKSGWAQERAEAVMAEIDALERDATNTRKIEQQANAARVEIRNDAREREDAINRTEPTALDCPRSQPFNALFDSVRSRQRQKAGGGQPPGAGPGR